MAWPCRAQLWGDDLGAARQAYGEVAKAIAEFEPVTMIARSDLAAEASLHCGTGVSVLALDQDDSWARDTGPTFVLDGQGAMAGIDWRYDGYGGRTPDIARDARIAEAICERLAITRFAAPIVMEGGGIHVDGEGTCLACAASVLDQRRNPGLGRDGAERLLGDHLGVDKVIWLEHGLIDDDTGGHVDNLACFVAPGVVLALVAGDQDDPDAPGLAANLDHLRAASDARGRTLEVITITAPRPRRLDDGRQQALSYLNFYLANDAVIMPYFDDPMDDAAFRRVARALSARTMVEIDASALVKGGGGIHCITQQQPSAARAAGA
jgi:agmatine deiminase